MPSIQEAISRFGLLPLVERKLKVGNAKNNYLPLLIFSLAIIPAALQIQPVEICFGAAILFMLVLDIIPKRKVYNMIEWPIVVLLAALIPIGNAFKNQGATEIAQIFTSGLKPFLGHIFTGHHQVDIAILAALMIITMTLSNFLNNAATAILHGPYCR